MPIVHRMAILAIKPMISRMMPRTITETFSLEKLHEWLFTSLVKLSATAYVSHSEPSQRQVLALRGSPFLCPENTRGAYWTSLTGPETGG